MVFKLQSKTLGIIFLRYSVLITALVGRKHSCCYYWDSAQCTWDMCRHLQKFFALDISKSLSSLLYVLFFKLSTTNGWWRGVVGNAFRLKRSYSKPGLVSTAMGDCLPAGKPSRCEACQLGRLSLLPSVGR